MEHYHDTEWGIPCHNDRKLFEYLLMERYNGMIRSRRKIEAIVNNARCFLRVCDEFGSFDAYFWRFTDRQTYIYRHHLNGEWITRNELSATIAADLKKRGFKYLGSTLIYSFMQSIGMVNDHAAECPMFEHVGGVIVE